MKSSLTGIFNYLEPIAEELAIKVVLGLNNFHFLKYNSRN